MDETSPERIAQMKEENLGPLSIALVVAFTIVSFVSVCLRFYTRIRLVHNVGLEDYFILFSMCFSICMAACQIMQAQWGNGRHAMFIDLASAQMILKYLFFSILTYNASLTCTKLSILLQYRRIFTVKKMRLPIYIVMGLCIGYGVSGILTGIFTCIPVRAFWSIMEKPTAKCVNENVLWYANAAINITTDLLVAVLPIKAIWDLQMPRKQKIALVIILSIGWFVCLVSILRLHALVDLANHPFDKTYYSTATAYWSAIEVNLGIVCASTPALKALVIKIIPRFSTSRFTSSSNRGGTKQSSGGKSFIELKEKPSEGSMVRSGGLEAGRNSDGGDDGYGDSDDGHVTALPSVDLTRGRILYTTEISQFSGRASMSESQKDLVGGSESGRGNGRR